MATTWTSEQLSAIETRDKTLLVSAAAGSGKTATLTERIIRSLTDPEKPLNIDSVLVVTFTKPAATELRAKISRALSKAVEENPDNQHLKRQLNLLPAAKIRTIDSFCNEILRANCDRVGISPGFRIADGAECELLAMSIIEGLIEALYNNELPEIANADEFEELCDCLTDSGKIEELASVFRVVHMKFENAEEGIDALGSLIENYNCKDTPLDKTLYGSFLMDRFHRMTEHYLSCYERYIREMSPTLKGEEKCLITLKSDCELLKKLHNAKDYTSAREIVLTYELEKKKSVSASDATALTEGFAGLRDMMKADLEEEKKKFHYTEEQWQELYGNLYRLGSIFYRFLKEFDRQFAEEKRRHNAFSFSDILRYTYSCLIQDGRPTDIAMNVSSQFDAIYIDEYQDVNRLQHRVFEAISRPDNRFMVGDIKQSIYVFRDACPEIFASMKKSFPPLKVSSGDYASIFMSSNFRCDEGIIDFVNKIFDRAFDFVADSIGYVSSDRLKFAKVYSEKEMPTYQYPTVCLVDKQSNGGADTADVVARKIKDLIENGRLNNGEPIRPSDIAIILRSAAGKDGKYAEALGRYGIPACISSEKEFFLCAEVRLALCLLNVIDNPRRDIYLAGLLKSPLFAFTTDDLYKISLMGEDSLYLSLTSYVEQNPDFLKGKNFLKTLDYYRSIAEGIGVDRLIDKLYSETGLMALASRNGGKENLTLLYDYARSYEAGAFKGLYNFIHFINGLIDKKTEFDDARTVEDTNAVRIITAHKSKGLEYPVVFFSEMDASIYGRSRGESRIEFSDGFGFSFLLRTPSGLAVADNPMQHILKSRNNERRYEEELRVLYVALTRAREQLYVVGKCPTVKRDDYDRRMLAIKDNLTEYMFRSLKSFLEIIVTCDGREPINEETLCPSLDSDEEQGVTESVETEDAPKEYDEGLYDTLKERFTFRYPRELLTTLPEKMSVSLMSPTILDGSEADEVTGSLLVLDESEPAMEEDARPILPSFIGGTDADESAKRGIATHLFMQFCDLDNLVKNGARAELTRLNDRGFISDEDSKRVRIYEIEKFRKSHLIKEMTEAKRLHRELRFNVYLAASNFTSSEEKREAYRDRDILVQGVIDCIIEREDGSIILCDYKTDRLSSEELSNPTLAAKTLNEKHSMQLGLYSLAVEKIFGKKPESVKVYSLPLGDTIDIV